MDDLISRQEAIDALMIAPQDWDGMFIQDLNVRIREKIEALPSAQPTQCNSSNVLRHPQCANRTKLGNCDPVGGFCASVPKEICDAQSEKRDDVIRKSAVKHVLLHLPSAQPERIQNNAVHLCDSCQYTYVTCPSHGNDTIFGGGKGNDNICACNKYRPISAQPEKTQLSEEDATSDCISRQAAIDVLEERLQANGYSNVALVSEFNRSIGYLMRLPSAQPIIRCKECKYYNDSDGCFFSTAGTMEDGFCNWAERKTDG